MKILFAASECAPFFKSGGLGDVIEALPKELAKNKENEISVILPYYKTLKEDPTFNPRFIKSFYFNLSWRNVYAGIFKLKKNNVTYFFIDNEYYFLREGSYYGHFDDGERFAFFSKAVLEFLSEINYFPDIIHLNDWQTAPVSVFYRAFFEKIPEYSQIKTVFTIHNIEYQGKMPFEFSDNCLGIPPSYRDLLTFGDCLNFLKGAVICSDAVTTVSETYAHEIKYPYFSHGLDSVLWENAYKLRGITNGINQTLFSPSKDKALISGFSSKNPEGKILCKENLQKELNLLINPHIPLLSMVTRLVSHKGLDLVMRVFDEIMALDLEFVILGTGDKKYEDFFRSKENDYKDRFRAKITFDDSLSRRIYGGSDLYLMPSKSEPCGLSQMIAMRYGAIPIVRETGGLFDTVKPLDFELLNGEGMTFKTFNAHDMLNAIKRACDFYHDKDKYIPVIKNLLAKDFSWKNPASEYEKLYNSLL